MFVQKKYNIGLVIQKLTGYKIPYRVKNTRYILRSFKND